MGSLRCIYRHFCKRGNKKPGRVKRMQVRMQTLGSGEVLLTTSLQFFLKAAHWTDIKLLTLF